MSGPYYDIDSVPADLLAVQTALHVVIGTDVEAHDAGLTAFAAFNTNGLFVQSANNTYVGRSIAVTAGQLSVTNGDGVSGNPTLGLPADVLVPTVITVPNTGLHILDTNATHDMILKNGSDMTADRTVTVTPGDADRTIDLTAGSITAPAGTVVGTTDNQALTTKTFRDSDCFFVDNGDATKKLAFEVSGVTTGTTRTMTVPNASGTIMTRENAETATGLKTYSPLAAATPGYYMHWQPNDFAAGKTRAYVYKTSATDFQIGIEDGAAGSGVLNISTTGFTYNNSQVATLTGAQTFAGAIAFSLPPVMPSYTVGTVPSAATYARGWIYVSNESGGATMAYSNGTNWKRVQDIANIS